MIKAEFDRPKLEKSLREFSKKFGESNAQAVARWGVQTCRELAVETKVPGKTKRGIGKSTGGEIHYPWAKGAQEGAIIKDALKVITVKPTATRKNKRALTTPAAVNGWIESNRNAKGRSNRVPAEIRPVCSESVFRRAMRIRFKKAGMAKGAWLGAGIQIASFQTGSEKISIGKNFMSWTQKHKSKGSATKPSNGSFAATLIKNHVKYSSSGDVLQSSRANNAINWGLKKTVKWYSKALKEQDKKQKV